MSRPFSLQEWQEERDAVLLRDDVEALRAHLVKYGDASAATKEDDVLRVAWHKARTACKTIPLEQRRASVTWLTDRGFSHFADEGT